MPLWDWLNDRGCGIFLHISSLPSNQGIGCFGDSAKKFVDMLSTAGMKFWQICPLSPTGYGDSPYQPISSFAGNPYFIDLEQLKDDDLLSEEDLLELRKLSYNNVDYGSLYKLFWEILKKSATKFFDNGETKSEFDKYCHESGWWLENYCSFMALKDKFHQKPWNEWPSMFSTYKSAVKEIQNSPELLKLKKIYQFSQFIFEKQWRKLKKYANDRGISIIGDLPIFAGLDSSDVWADTHFFKIDKNFLPKFVAGVPPDAFSKTGQLWGNPVYDWEELSNDKYSWWINRIKRCFELYDVLRLDHFRGFCNAWEIPYSSTSAINGKWEDTAGIDFFKKLKHNLPKSKFIAEDLGDLDKRPQKLLSQAGLPGTIVLQFAFDSDSNNKYLPHNHEKNNVLYLGTHDNDTTRGWYESLDEATRHKVRSYLMIDGHDISWDMIKEAFKSTCNLLILSMQDILNLGSEARFNTPSKVDHNWQWRVTQDQLQELYNSDTPRFLRQLCDIYGR